MTILRRIILAIMLLGAVGVSVAGIWLHMQGRPLAGLSVAANAVFIVLAAYPRFDEYDLVLALLMGTTAVLMFLSARPYLGLG